MPTRPLTDHERQLLERTEAFVRDAMPEINAAQTHFVSAKIFRDLRKVWAAHMKQLRRKAMEK